MERKNYFQYFDPDNQLRPAIKKQSIVSLDDWELAWEILEPINIATTRRSEISLSKRLSVGQKALYFFWYLDAEVENGGFIQFYFNKTDYYLPSITEGLLFIKDKQMIKLLEAAESLYKKNEKVFARTKTVSGFSKLYDKIPGFSALDNKYYKLRDKTIKRIVDYFRQNPHEFVKLK
jgi:hypothetical protein